MSIAYVARDGVYITDGFTSRLVLSPTWGAYTVEFSPDGRYVAVSADDQLWLVDMMSGEASALISERPSDLLPEDTYWEGIAHLVVWIPGTTRLLVSFALDCIEGLCPLRDLRILDMSSGILATILPPGEGGEVRLCPDANTVVVAAPTRLIVVELDDLIPREMLTYEEAITYSGFAYAPQTVCMPDSQSAMVALAPRDILAPDREATRVVRVDFRSGAATTVASLDVHRFGLVLSPDGSRAIYRAGAGEEADLYPIRLRDLSIGEETTLTRAADFGALWSPDSTRFLFARDIGRMHLNSVVSLTEVGFEVRQIHSGYVSWAHWLGRDHILMEVSDKVYIFDLQGEAIPVAPYQYGYAIDAYP